MSRICPVYASYLIRYGTSMKHVRGKGEASISLDLDVLCIKIDLPVFFVIGAYSCNGIIVCLSSTGSEKLRHSKMVLNSSGYSPIKQLYLKAPGQQGTYGRNLLMRLLPVPPIVYPILASLELPY
jgi:hypothetical protein